MTPEDGRAFRDALGWFATGVTIITALSPDGELVGFTANSFTSVSLDPPLVLFNLNRHAKSLPVFENCDHFAINVLAEHQKDLSSRFASPAGDKWDGVGFAVGRTGCPVLAEALAIFECARFAVHDGGDHRIFLGQVLHIATAEDGKPLLFCRGSYRRLGAPIGAPAEPAQPGATSPLDGQGAIAGLEPWFSA